MRATLGYRWVATAGLALALALAPIPAGAHAAFVSSTPTPGAKLASAPGVVVIRFSEPLVKGLSEVVVADPTGAIAEGQPSGARDLVARLSTNAPGVYRVRWKTVSPLDGHTLRGTFNFGVGVAPADAEGATALSPRLGELAIAAARALEYAALLLSVGVVLVRRLARRAPGIGVPLPRLQTTMAVALGAGLAVALGEGVAASGSLGVLAAYFRTVPGAFRLLRVLLEALVVASSAAVPRLAEALVVAPILALAGAGHAAAARPGWWGMAVDGVHLLSAGVWAGGILALAAASPSLAGEPRRPGRGQLLGRFSPVAIPAFLVTVTTGYLRATQELAVPADLYRSAYGRVLSFKILAVAAMVPLSVMAWRRLITRPRAEAAVALVVVAAAALLAAFPLPPARIAEAGAEAKSDTLASGLPEQGDLTLGGYAGEVLVGATLRPGRPGANTLLVYVLPLEGEEKAGEVAVGASLGARRLDLADCGPTCRRGAVALAGGERLVVRVGGAGGGEAAFDIPPLPAPDGSALLAAMQRRMAALTRLRIEEALRPAKPPVEARYALQAPDRMRMQLSTGAETVTIGDTRYSRSSPGARWEVQAGIPPTPVPFYIWSPPPFIAPRIVASEAVEGTFTQVVSFFEDRGGTPIWFRVWVSADGLVRRAEMRAHGHFMDHRYLDFDAPFTINPP